MLKVGTVFCFFLTASVLCQIYIYYVVIHKKGKGKIPFKMQRIPFNIKYKNIKIPFNIHVIMLIVHKTYSK